MDIRINAEVYCSDGLAGTVRCVIINPVTKQVTDIAVREKRFPHLERRDGGLRLSRLLASPGE